MAWFWTIEHLTLAICLWGFLIYFHRMLRAATQRLVGWRTKGGARTNGKSA
jgi:hypothetical protein